jgi:4-hydroxy-tetrahydrodipicolinate reductase
MILPKIVFAGMNTNGEVMKKINVVPMGLGPIGNKETQYLLERNNVRIVGAIDSDPAKAGQDAGVLAGLPPIGVKVSVDLEQVPGKGGVDVAMLTNAIPSIVNAHPGLRTMADIVAPHYFL